MAIRRKGDAEHRTVVSSQFAKLTAGPRIPKPEGFVDSRRQQPGSVRRHRDRGHRHVMGGKHVNVAAIGRVPDADPAILVAGVQNVSGVPERDGVDRHAVLDPVFTCSAPQVPKPDRSVPACRRRRFAVGGDRQIRDLGGMALEPPKRGAGPQVPHNQDSVVSRRYGARAIGEECHGIDRSGMTVERAQLHLCAEIPETGRVIETGRHYPRSVRGNGDAANHSAMTGEIRGNRFSEASHQQRHHHDASSGPSRCRAVRKRHGQPRSSHHRMIGPARRDPSRSCVPGGSCPMIDAGLFSDFASRDYPPRGAGCPDVAVGAIGP